MQGEDKSEIGFLKPCQNSKVQKLIEGLYCAYYSDLCRFLKRLKVEAGKEEEIAQDVYIRLLRMNELERLELEPKSYIFKIALNIVRDIKRREKIFHHYQQEQKARVSDIYQVSTPEMELMAKQTKSILRQAILGLPKEYRTILFLHRFRGLTCREISIRMNISQRSVERYLSRAVASCHASLRRIDK